MIAYIATALVFLALDLVWAALVLAEGSWKTALVYGALFGFFAYAT